MSARQYKHGSGASVADAKRLLKERCVAAMKSRRADLVARHRGLATDRQNVTVGDELQSIVQVAVAGFCGGAGGIVSGGEVDPMMDDDNVGAIELSSADFADIMRHLEESWRQEMMEEERKALEHMAFEEARANADAEAAAVATGTEVYGGHASPAAVAGVVCPLCLAGRVIKNRNVFICQCGLRLDAQTDFMTLEQFGQSLSDAHVLHSTMCSNQPACSMQDQFGQQLLTMQCAKCAFLQVIM